MSLINTIDGNLKAEHLPQTEILKDHTNLVQVSNHSQNSVDDKVASWIDYIQQNYKIDYSNILDYTRIMKKLDPEMQERLEQLLTKKPKTKQRLAAKQSLLEPENKDSRHQASQKILKKHKKSIDG